MKQILLTLGVLLLVMFGFYWVSNRYQVNKKIIEPVTEKQIYFEIPNNLTAETETEIKLKAKNESGKLVSYAVDFSYDMSFIKVINVEINKDIFDKSAEAKIDEDFGKVKMVGESNKKGDELTNGEVILATIKIKGLKKGETMIYSSKRPEVGILDNGKITKGNFQMPNFKVNFL